MDRSMGGVEVVVEVMAGAGVFVSGWAWSE